MANHRILYAQTEAYGFLALSLETPRFCVSGNTREEVKTRAAEALDFYASYAGIEINYENNKEKNSSAPTWFAEDRICA